MKSATRRTTLSIDVPSRAQACRHVPYDFVVDRERCRVTIVSRDPVGLADAIAVIDRQAAEGLWSFATLHDARAVTWIPTPDDARVILQHVLSISRIQGIRGPVAFVTGHHASFGFTRLHEFIGEQKGLRFKACSTMDEAEQWLAEADVS